MEFQLEGIMKQLCIKRSGTQVFLSTTEPSVETLRITWNPKEDIFTFKVSIIEKASYIKRNVLILMARLYYPSLDLHCYNKSKNVSSKVMATKSELGP
ncbi:hypothetical protein AVEN_271108-1 [Araneus ventricosus]|uniref:Uncharacterized protein n=1 Tax=Araneus ventricosus TaxID=182803 RepID=A0A4Y2E3Q0_ARAVE|nr:hypothetical protein AVEN_271108-1 [Araneus ventricosus]